MGGSHSGRSLACQGSSHQAKTFRFQQWIVQCVVGSQNHVIFMLLFAFAVSVVLIALSLPVIFPPSPKCFTPVPRGRWHQQSCLLHPGLLVGERAAEYSFCHRGSEETNVWAMNGMSSLVVRVGEVYVAQTAQWRKNIGKAASPALYLWHCIWGGGGKSIRSGRGGGKLEVFKYV